MISNIHVLPTPGTSEDIGPSCCLVESVLGVDTGIGGRATSAGRWD